MCLDVVYRGKEKEEALAKLPARIYVWKTIRRHRYNAKSFVTPHQRYPVHAGQIMFLVRVIRRLFDTNYRAGGHFWRTRKGAECWRIGTSELIVRCVIQKKDITTIGEQWDRLVICAKKATFPKWLGKKTG